MKTCISIACSTMKVDSFFKYAVAQLQSMTDCGNISDIPIIFWYDAMPKEQRDLLEKIWENIEFRKIDGDKYKAHGKFSPGWFCLEGWTLTEYDKVIIMDCDFICQGSLNKLVDDECDFGMVKEWTGIYNGGLAVLGKKYLESDWYEKIMNLDPMSISIGGNRDKFSKDQKIYNYYFKNEITALPHTFNWLVSEKGVEPAAMIHYIYKPLYDVGRKQLENINPDLITRWEKYLRKGYDTAGIQE